MAKQTARRPTVTSSLNAYYTASARGLYDLGRDRAGTVLRSQGADCFLIYVVCSTGLFPEATQLKPQRGPNYSYMGIVLKHDAFQCRPQSKWSPSLPSRTPNPSREIENEKSADGHCHQRGGGSSRGMRLEGIGGEVHSTFMLIYSSSSSSACRRGLISSWLREWPCQKFMMHLRCTPASHPRISSCQRQPWPRTERVASR